MTGVTVDLEGQSENEKFFRVRDTFGLQIKLHLLFSPALSFGRCLLFLRFAVGSVFDL